MAVGLASATADAILDAMDNGTAFQITTGLFAKLHVGDPGAAGTANAAAETTRKAISFAAASGGSKANDTAITWSSISGSEDATHFTVWDNVSAGTFRGSGTVTANAYTDGDDFVVAIGAAVLSLDVATDP